MNALYLFLIYALIPLAVIVVALVGRRVLTFPHRLVPGLAVEDAYVLSVTVLASLGIGLEMLFAVWLAQR